MRFVIVGGGVAGITAALDLSRRKAGDIVVYSDEEYPYYYRPQLTEFLAGDLPLSRLLRRPLSWYEERGISVRLGRPVTAIHPERKSITVAESEEAGYDKLLLAMGSLPFVPPIPGMDKTGVLTWRTLEDTLEMEKASVTCQQVAIIGGGLLGLEAARGLRGFCHDITVVEFFPRLMPRQLDEQGAQLLKSFVESLGIKVLTGAQSQELVGEGRVRGIRLKSGEIIPASTVIVAAGVRCNAQLAEDAGLVVDRGVVVDTRMATSDPDIYAAGDTAVYKGYSWAIAPIAQAQARIAAANMAGEEVHYDVVVPSTTLKVIGIDVSSVGYVNPEGDESVEIRKLDAVAGTYKKIVLTNGIIVGTIVINDRQLAKDLENRIAARQPMTEEDAAHLVGAAEHLVTDASI
jgi:nitrite reductase (NADH) large subunit